MAGETIMLAKNLDVKKLDFPCAASEKLDGVPAVFRNVHNGAVNAFTRQGELLASVEHINSALYGLIKPGHELVGELYVPGMSFKDIGGLVRRQYASPELILYVWDYSLGNPNATYAERMTALVDSDLGRAIFDAHNYGDGPMRIIEAKHIEDEKQLHKHCENFTHLNPESEGLIFRPLHGKHSTYEPAKRSWGFQRFKAEETVDLKLVGIEEAVSEDGEPKDMAGRLICEYKGKQIGVGPGALKHGERIFIFHNQDTVLGKIIEVAYKPDPAYTALREARFKRFRDDKAQPNIE